MNDVFRAKIPNFIAALPIWNDTPMNDVYKAPKSLKHKEPKKRVVKKKPVSRLNQERKLHIRQCLICAKDFNLPNPASKQKTCCHKCGRKLAEITKSKNRKLGLYR